MQINKQNIIMYKNILNETEQKKEIYRYIFWRMLGTRKLFVNDVIISNNGISMNCGKNFDNCTIAVSSFEDYIKDELDMSEGSFIDVGAHIGKHSLYAAKKLGSKGKVLSIEADSETSELLRTNVALNNLHNIKVFEVVCLDMTRLVNFYSDYYSSTNSVFINDRERKADSKISFGLDDLFPNIKDVKIIKIDVEGAETMVIDGAMHLIKNNLPKIIFEGNKNVEGIQRRLKGLNYSIRHLQEDNYVAEVLEEKQ